MQAETTAATKAPKPKARRNEITKIKVDALDRAMMIRSLRTMFDEGEHPRESAGFDGWCTTFLGFVVDEDTTSEALSTAMHVAFQADKSLNCIGPCSKCDGFSPDSFEACPFCGDADDGTTVSVPPVTLARSGSNGEGAPPEEKSLEPVPEVAATSGKKPKKEKVSRAKKASEAVPAQAAPVPATAMVKAEPEPVAASPIVQGVVEGSISLASLDEAVVECRKLAGIGAMAQFRLGSKLLEIRKRGLYSLRLKDDGRAAYKTFEAFCLNELNMTSQHAYNLMNVAERYDEEYVTEYGASKLALVFRVSEAERPAVERNIEEGKSWRAIEQQVRATNAAIADREITTRDGKVQKVGARSPVPVAIPREPKITVSAILGSHTVKLYKAATVSKKTEAAEWTRARRLGDEPVGTIELENHVVLTIKVVEGKDGHLEARAIFRREES